MSVERHPKVAIIDANTLAAIGLRQMLQNVMPIMSVHVYGSIAELEANDPDSFFHYFVAMSLVIEHRQFFYDHRQKTIVLTMSTDQSTYLKGFHVICINQPEPLLVRSLLKLEQYAHAQGRNLPEMMPDTLERKVLTDREIEVLALIVQGYINKEIADRLNIGLTTVITHRKNIMEKLGMKSVSALTIYAVMHGYVDINKI